ncbi:MAG: hypothetical protein ACFB9M_04305 [Myxococcota bacterium]
MVVNKRNGATRLSFHLYNTLEDVHCATEAIEASACDGVSGMPSVIIH